MSAVTSEREVRAVPGLAESLGRSLRHELGDFLQKVYASVAILEARLPAEWRTEREILTRLRDRAESCRQLLDTVQDYLCPLTLDCQPVDLANLAHEVTEAARPLYPHLKLAARAEHAAVVKADSDRMAQVAKNLLANACEAARGQVVFETSSDPLSGNLQWSIRDDGPGISSEMNSRLFRPFVSTRPGHLGLGLALAQKLVLLHGGRINLANQPDGGCRCQVWLPAERNGTSVSPEGETAT